MLVALLVTLFAEIDGVGILGWVSSPEGFVGLLRSDCARTGDVIGFAMVCMAVMIVLGWRGDVNKCIADSEAIDQVLDLWRDT